MKLRSQIDDKYKWDLTQFCEDESKLESRFLEIENLIKTAGKFEGKLKDKKILWDYLQFMAQYQKLVSPVMSYIGNSANIDLSNVKYQVLSERLSIIFTKFNKATSYVEPELGALSDKYLDEIIHDPKFKDYDYTFRTLKKQKKHTPSKNDAKLLAAINFANFGDNHALFTDSGLKYEDAVDKNGKEHELSEATYYSYSQSKDEVLRKSASKNILKDYGQFIDFLTSNYLSEIKKEVFYARAAKYDHTLDSYLDSENVSRKVYDSLLKNVEKNIPLIGEYYKLKKKALGVKSLNSYDLNVPVSKAAAKKYTFEEGYKLIEEALGVLGKDYVSVLEQARREHWIDVMPSKNKISGAYSSSFYGYKPMALLNFDGTYNAVSTTAHEMGHSMHSYLSNKTQPREKASYPIFLAEIASTTNELLLANYRLKNLTGKEKLEAYDQLLGDIDGTVFRQMMFSEFEKTVIEGVEKEQPLDKETLCKLYFDLCKKYMPTIKLLPELKYGWARIPHFYYGFYVYKYAVGMICALNFSSRILSGEKGAVESYLKFLSSGGCKEPNEILKDVGCDLEKEETYTKAFTLIKEYLAEFKNLIK